MDNLRKIIEKSPIMLGEKLLNKIASLQGVFNHFYSLWESKGYKIEGQNDQLHLT